MEKLSAVVRSTLGGILVLAAASTAAGQGPADRFLRGYIETTQLALRAVPWQDHEELARLTQWRPAPRPKAAAKPVDLLRRPEQPGALKVSSVQVARSPGQPMQETKATATGRPALALVRDLMPSRKTLPDLRAEVADAAVLSSYPGTLQRLRCDGGDPATLAAELLRLTSLRQIELGRLLDDGVASALLSHDQLAELTAGSVSLSDAGIFALGHLPRLRKLVLWGDLAAVRGHTMPMLQRIQCLLIAAPLAASSPVLQEAVRLPGLHELQFVLRGAPPEGEALRAIVEPLASLPYLRRLGLVAIEGSLSPCLPGIACLPLTHLRIGCAALSDEDVQAIARIKTLRELDLSDVRFERVKTAVAAFAGLPHLEILGLGRSNWTVRHRLQLLDALPTCAIEHEAKLSDGKPVRITERNRDDR